jgi:hypothetical protein
MEPLSAAWTAPRGMSRARASCAERAAMHQVQRCLLERSHRVKLGICLEQDGHDLRDAGGLSARSPRSAPCARALTSAAPCAAAAWRGVRRQSTGSVTTFGSALPSRSARVTSALAATHPATSGVQPLPAVAARSAAGADRRADSRAHSLSVGDLGVGLGGQQGAHRRCIAARGGNDQRRLSQVAHDLSAPGAVSARPCGERRIAGAGVPAR